MTIDDIPERLRKEIVRRHYQAIQARSVAKRLRSTTPAERSAQSHRAQAARWSRASEADRLAHGALLNRASQASFAKRRKGKSFEQLRDARRAQKLASKKRVKLARQSAVTPIILPTVDTAPATHSQAPPPPTSNCPRCGQPSDGGLCAGCVLSAALPKHVRD